MVPEISLNHRHSSGLENIQNVVHRKSEVCLWSIVLQPHDIQVSPMSEPSLQHCRIRRHFIEKVSSNQISWPHTRSYHHSRRIMFQLLLEMGSLLWMEHLISVMPTAIDGRVIVKRIIELYMALGVRVPQRVTWVIATIHVGIRQFIHESRTIRPHFHVFLHVLSSWSWHTKLWWSFPRRLLWGTLNGNNKLCAVEI